MLNETVTKQKQVTLAAHEEAWNNAKELGLVMKRLEANSSLKQVYMRAFKTISAKLLEHKKTI